ncbi:MAG: rRNA maturation RNase YbeY [Bacilli bacterium]|nr:rRNA maturation RNase YbeY [Bacilli bacterium]MDD4054132.1 rRNA maturation RNase YbeY [Bacilli bacterium]MDD4411191.1 rRNA maturation RNase YbeY [Bacilli bacterium]
MNEISFVNETNEKIEEIAVLEKLIDFAVSREQLNNVIFSIIFIKDEKMHKLNKQYREIDSTTDVLSFAFEDNAVISNDKIRMLGEIYISVDKAREQAFSYEHTYLRELSFLMIHGFLHLLGFNHMEEEEEKEMFLRQEEILNEYGIEK